MKPYRNVYILHEQENVNLTGNNVIPYTGEILYGVTEQPEGFDPEQDIYYRCSCDFGEIKEFQKV